MCSVYVLFTTVEMLHNYVFRGANTFFGIDFIAASSKTSCVTKFQLVKRLVTNKEVGDSCTLLEGVHGHKEQLYRCRNHPCWTYRKGVYGLLITLMIKKPPLKGAETSFVGAVFYFMTLRPIERFSVSVKWFEINFFCMRPKSCLLLVNKAYNLFE